MKELVSYIAKALVEQPEEVEVSEIEGEHSLVVELKVAKSDMGRIIGWFRSLSQLKDLLKSVLQRYGKIIKYFYKLIVDSLKLIFISVNYLAAFLLIPAIIFYFTHLITKEYLTFYCCSHSNCNIPYHHVELFQQRNT